MNDQISKETILTEFGKFTAKLHKLGIYHNDYSLGNVLFKIKDRKPVFTLVDINRMNFGEMSFKKRCKNFHRLAMNPARFEIIANAYAQEMGYDKEKTLEAILESHQKKSTILILKRKIKGIFRRKKIERYVS